MSSLYCTPKGRVKKNRVVEGEVNDRLSKWGRNCWGARKRTDKHQFMCKHIVIYVIQPLPITAGSRASKCYTLGRNLSNKTFKEGRDATSARCTLWHHRFRSLILWFPIWRQLRSDWISLGLLGGFVARCSFQPGLLWCVCACVLVTKWHGSPVNLAVSTLIQQALQSAFINSQMAFCSWICKHRPPPANQNATLLWNKRYLMHTDVCLWARTHVRC